MDICGLMPITVFPRKLHYIEGQAEFMKRWRHLIIAVCLVPAISFYVMLCLYLAGFLTGLHWALDLVYFIFAGLAWLYPAGWVVKWLAATES